MTAKKTKPIKKPKSKAFVIFMIFLLVIILAAIAVGGKFAIDYIMEQYDRNTHPQKFSQLVENYADENGLDKDFVYAVIKTESGFNPEAESGVGARGLMQIMEETFDWIKYRLDDGDEITFDSMYEPEQNIRYGTYLLGYLNGVFGNRECTAAAYHAGVNAVLGWLEDTTYSSDGSTLDAFPSSITEHYVNKIEKAYQTYKTLYKEQ